MTPHAKQGTSARLEQANGLSLTVKRGFETHHLGQSVALPGRHVSLCCIPSCSATPTSKIALIKHWVSQAVTGTVGTAQVEQVCETLPATSSSPKKPPCASIMELGAFP